MVDFDDAKNLKKQADDKGWSDDAEKQMRDRFDNKNNQDDQQPRTRKPPRTKFPGRPIVRYSFYFSSHN
jgi:hypothetical protein